MAGAQADTDHKTLAYKDSLIADFVKVDDANQAAAAGLPSPFWSVKWDFVLARKDQVGCGSA
jgi:hypothetical protein